AARAMTKVCCRCRDTKDIDAFGARVESRDGRRSRCRSCEAELASNSRREHPERQLEANRRYARTHPEKIRAAGKRNYERHRDRFIASARKWSGENPARVR